MIIPAQFPTYVFRRAAEPKTKDQYVGTVIAWVVQEKPGPGSSFEAVEGYPCTRYALTDNGKRIDVYDAELQFRTPKVGERW